MFSIGDLVETSIAAKTIKGVVVAVTGDGRPTVKWRSSAMTTPRKTQLGDIRLVGHMTICPECKTGDKILYGDDVTCECGHVIITREEMAFEAI